jgi:hypothetical protein
MYSLLCDQFIARTRAYQKFLYLSNRRSLEFCHANFLGK